MRKLIYIYQFFYGRHHDVLVECLEITKNALNSSTTNFLYKRLHVSTLEAGHH